MVKRLDNDKLYLLVQWHGLLSALHECEDPRLLQLPVSETLDWSVVITHDCGGCIDIIHLKRGCSKHPLQEHIKPLGEECPPTNHIRNVTSPPVTILDLGKACDTDKLMRHLDSACIGEHAFEWIKTVFEDYVEFREAGIDFEGIHTTARTCAEKNIRYLSEKVKEAAKNAAKKEPLRAEKDFWQDGGRHRKLEEMCKTLLLGVIDSHPTL